MSQIKVFLNNTANAEDIRCVIMARLGFSYKYIAEQTGLNANQIAYRMQQLGIKITDYRDGKTELAQRFTKLAQMDAAGIGQQITKLLANTAPAPAEGVEA